MALTTTLGLARARDAILIAEMSRDLIEHGLGWSWTPARVRQFLSHRDSTVVVARRDERLAAFALLHVGDTSAHLNLLAVGPEHRRQGLGLRMLDWLCLTATESGVFRVDLEVRYRNSGARAFYERAGFAETGRTPGYYRGVETALRMTKDLAHRP
ncbi:MAG: GNAT family N-acetyltransferase [Gammaproteobacteria bacterium]|nr:GNAT family N-acetyltransferase [Gammaproteobacteria bacterium]MDE2348137.1 GNAT family N-acetyltransferase [Gammaproteobacteria bacterium]